MAPLLPTSPPTTCTFGSPVRHDTKSYHISQHFYQCNTIVCHHTIHINTTLNFYKQYHTQRIMLATPAHVCLSFFPACLPSSPFLSPSSYGAFFQVYGCLPSLFLNLVTLIETKLTPQKSQHIHTYMNTEYLQEAIHACLLAPTFKQRHVPNSFRISQAHYHGVAVLEACCEIIHIIRQVSAWWFFQVAVLIQIVKGSWDIHIYFFKRIDVALRQDCNFFWMTAKHC